MAVWQGHQREAPESTRLQGQMDHVSTGRLSSYVAPSYSVTKRLTNGKPFGGSGMCIYNMYIYIYIMYY